MEEGNTFCSCLISAHDFLCHIVLNGGLTRTSPHRYTFSLTPATRLLVCSFDSWLSCIIWSKEFTRLPTKVAPQRSLSHWSFPSDVQLVFSGQCHDAVSLQPLQTDLARWLVQRVGRQPPIKTSYSEQAGQGKTEVINTEALTAGPAFLKL